MDVYDQGPPPRVWGKHRQPPVQRREYTVHPHACGENMARYTLAGPFKGPPPRVWGKRSLYARRVLLRWSTPTRVGKTHTGQRAHADDQVHPHACGENGRKKGQSKWRRRSTPTRVGKTKGLSHRVGHIKVHPHACGENYRLSYNHPYEDGPPPRVWGKHINARQGPRPIRSTPTRVGKTVGLDIPTTAATVHPHACGENLRLTNVISGRSGPPPRVWGKHRLGHHTFQNRTVHPHACGEN